MYEVTSFLVRY